MPIWSHDPPPQPRGPALPIRRTPAYKPLVAIATSDDLVGCYTHFYKGHTVPCEGQDCPAHQDGIPFRWHAYLAAVDFHTGLHFIFECTAQAADHFTAYRDSNHGLRGCFFQAQRLNKRPNGRVIIQTKPIDLSDRCLPHAPDLTQCLAILWSLPQAAVTAPRRDPEKKTAEVLTDAEIIAAAEHMTGIKVGGHPPAQPKNDPTKLSSQAQLNKCSDSVSYVRSINDNEAEQSPQPQDTEHPSCPTTPDS